MGISTDISGTSNVGGANQLLDLLSLVSNPAVYKSKIDALEAVTAENKKFVELVGPADSIVKMRETIALELADVKSTAAEAKKTAAEAVAAAKVQAAEMVSDAQAKADALKAEAQALVDEAKVDATATKAALSAAKKAKVDADAVSADFAARSKSLADAQAEVDAIKAEITAATESILAKHQEFLASLLSCLLPHTQAS